MNNQRIRNRAAAVIVEDEKILLVQHHKYDRQYWLLPGGGVEFGETLADAVRREVWEETGLETAINDLIFVSESIPPDGHRHVINYYFSVAITGGELKLGDDPYLCDVQWHRLDDLPHLIVFPNVVRELQEWLQSETREKISLGNRWE